jgi:hypothetical protein
MRTNRPRTAKPRVNQCRSVSPEADALSRELQAELSVSANELAERAIYALAAACGRNRVGERTPAT